ncbi:GtrA family protein [Halorubrum ejinorense]|uniref:GtrA family protein n=1 Tax=Halorubrum ejinorense TaxID=425309 RepID=A0AAV3SR57_9EURY
MIRAALRDLLSGPIAVQMRRFVVVGALTAGLQLALLWLFVDYVGLNYLVGAAIAIEITIICSYVLNNAWTFRARQNTGFSEYLTGLLKTNLVRGTAIPIQLGVLAVLVEWAGVPYLIANVPAILISGLYRFVLDAKWTWG